MAQALALQLEQQVPGFKASFGGEELKRATAALSGAVAGSRRAHQVSKEAPRDAREADEQPASASGAGTASLSALLSQPTTSADMSENDLLLRELALAANQYAGLEASSSGSGSQDADTSYNHGLVLQELAGKMAHNPAEQLQLLKQACEQYSAAVSRRPSHHAALYNWGVALSDCARLQAESDPPAALACLQAASHRYASALELGPGNPLALNNWGLVLQEMSSHAAPGPERDALVGFALEKFRHAVRLRPDFDRGAYNLGTVLYGAASAGQAELAAQLKAGRLTSPDPATSRERQGREARLRGAFAAAAQYIALAAALQPTKEIYSRSLAVVRPLLPLPFLRAGYLTAPTGGGPGALGGAGEAWRRAWFVLDGTSLRGASDLEASLCAAGATGPLGSAAPTLRIGAAVGERPLVVPLDAVVEVRRCQDPSLPPGEALWLHLSRPVGDAPGAGAGAAAAAVRAMDSGAGAASGGDAAAWQASLQGALGSAARPPDLPSDVSEQSAEEGAAGADVTAVAAAAVAEALSAWRRSAVWLVADDAEAADAWVDAILLARHVVGSRGQGALERVLQPSRG